MRNILKTILAILARLTLSRFKPRVIGITGSVGKTSAKEAITLALSSKFKVRSSFENYNNELGLPLSAIGEYSGGRSFLSWIFVVIKGFAKLFGANYPQVLVLEMGSDRPGDIEYLLSVAGKLDAAVVTDIGISHLEFFRSPEALAKEKLSIFKGLNREGTVVANFDSPKVREGLKSARTNVLTYGFDQGASLYASDFQILKKDNSFGANFKIHYEGTVVPIFLPNALGLPAAYCALAAAAVGVAFGLNLVDISASLRDFTPPPGRLRLLTGIKQTKILDDTYNSAPSSTLAALETLKAVGGSRLIAALGEMAELGSASEEGHRAVAVKILESGIQAVFLVGDKTKLIADELKKRRFPGQVFWFVDSDSAGIPIQNYLQPADAILIKGSQSMRMEKIVKEIMAEPLKAEQLLVRQTKKWLDKP